MRTHAVICAEEVTYAYAGSTQRVGPFTFTAHAGEFHLLSGRSGCGKSTLARLLSGMIPHLYRGALGGRVLVNGEATDRTPLWKLCAAVGLVAQNPGAQMLAATVRGEIGFGLESAGLTGDEMGRRIEEALEQFELSAYAERDPCTLSGGEQQRLIIAALAARQPQALVLDEPASMLDAGACARLAGHLAALSCAGTAVVVFEHRPEVFREVGTIMRRELSSAATTEPSAPELPQRIPPFRLMVDALSVQLGQRTVLDGIALELHGGEVVALVGANGSGKTTLLRALAGLQAHGGRVTLGGAAAHAYPHVGICFDNPDRQLFNPTVRDEILYGLADYDADFYRSVVQLLGLSAYESTPPLLLSEGEKKRLGVAVALLRPGLCGLCLDEPTLGADATQRRILGKIIRRLAEAGYLCVLATHDLEWAAQWSDRIFALAAGRVTPVRSAATGDALAMFPSAVRSSAGAGCLEVG